MVPSARIRALNTQAVNPAGRYVIYWMQMFRRLEYNFALEYAVERANEFSKPLLIYEALRCDYPWASDRIHRFVLQGTKENQELLKRKNISRYCYVEHKPGEGKGLVSELMRDAAVMVTDDYPAFVTPGHNQKLGPAAPIPFAVVDSNGIIPMSISTKAPYSAYEFRRLMQKHFLVEFSQFPAKDPLDLLQNRSKVTISDDIIQRWPDCSAELADIDRLIQIFPIDHKVLSVPMNGTRQASLEALNDFMTHAIHDYSEKRNHPDLDVASHLSPYLHFGKISAHEIVAEALRQQPKGWTVKRIRFNNGSKEGFFGGDASVEAFLDQLITWRETGFHFCRHVPHYDSFDSLPDWAVNTLAKHSIDPRETLYDLTQFENAATHDALWNAAQRQLIRKGMIHNYLRMLWGKKILEWTSDPRTALDVMIELNNKYGIDGRDPNSYSGIFWILGRFDRPWAPQRPIFGSIRYMSSENMARKVRIKQYLQKYGPD
jgi:deoxyribodipyrimidine photo-lyase